MHTAVVNIDAYFEKGSEIISTGCDENGFLMQNMRWRMKTQHGKVFCLPNTKKLFQSLVFLPPLLTNLPSPQKREVNLNLLVPTTLVVQPLSSYCN